MIISYSFPVTTEEDFGWNVVKSSATDPKFSAGVIRRSKPIKSWFFEKEMAKYRKCK